LILMPLHIARIALIPMGWGISLVLKLAHAVGTLPHALILVPPFSGTAVALMALGLSLLGLLRTKARFTGLAPIALGLLLAVPTAPPDALISSHANLTALRTRHGILILVAGRRDRFLLHQWRPLWPGQNFHIHAAARYCPDGRCRADHGAILFLLNRAAADRGCGHAKIIISPRPLHGACRGAGRIELDRFAPWRDGAIAIRHASTHPTILTDRSIEGTRPWVPPWPAWR
jgi:competence protein ComEC